jgi:hypothetical protein
MVFVAFFIAKSTVMCQKSQKETLSFCFKAGRPLTMMKKHHSHSFQTQRRQEGCCSCLQSPSCHRPKQKRRGDRTKNQTHWCAKISKFKKFKNAKMQF